MTIFLDRIALAAIFATSLAACGPAHTNDTVASLAADPERLKEVRRLCREERTKVSDDTCRRAAEATNRRFFGDRPEQPAK